MSNQPNWNEAPKCATHWDIYGGVFCDIDGFWFGDGEYMELVHVSWGTDRYIPRPTINQQLTVVNQEFTTEKVVVSKMETTPEFNNIPEGATHYRPECYKWYFSWAKYEYGRIYIYSEEEPWWEHWGTFPVEELIPITSNTTDLYNQLKTEWIESIIENKEELYRQLGYRYDTIVGNKG